MRYFKWPNPRIDVAYRALVELELAFRSFEKQLMANLLKDSANYKH